MSNTLLTAPFDEDDDDDGNGATAAVVLPEDAPSGVHGDEGSLPVSGIGLVSARSAA